MDEAPPTDRTGNVRGDLIGGAYVVERTLGEGASGVVFAARRREDSLPVAVKIGRTADPQAASRFQAQARAMQRLKSPYAVRVLDVGATPDGVPWSVMELLDGKDLASLLAERGRLDVDDVIRWVLQACRALAEAHEANLWHRDIKPHNLFVARRPPSVDTDGRPEAICVLDYGLVAPVLSLDPGAMRLAKPGGIVGTSHYMAPEQIHGRIADARTDIWAIGTTLYHLLGSRFPFGGSTVAEVCRGILEIEPPDIVTLRPDVPRSVGATIARCLSKEPRDRFVSMRELLRALRDARAELRNTPMNTPAVEPSLLSALEAIASSGSGEPSTRTLVFQPSAAPSSEDEVTRVSPHASAPLLDPHPHPHPHPPPPSGPPSSDGPKTQILAPEVPKAKPAPMTPPPAPAPPKPADPLAEFGDALAKAISESGLDVNAGVPKAASPALPPPTPRSHPSSAPSFAPTFEASARPVRPAPAKPAPKKKKRGTVVFVLLVLAIAAVAGFLRFSGRLPQIDVPRILDR